MYKKDKTNSRSRRAAELVIIKKGFIMLIELTKYRNKSKFKLLLKSLPSAEQHYQLRVNVASPKSIGASGSMFRVFKGIEKPSSIYKNWGFSKIKSKNFIGTVLSIKSQKDFNIFHKKLGASLERYWLNNTFSKLTFAHKYKLVNLFIKRACELNLGNDKINEKLILFGHVPLDSLVLKTIDEMYSGIFLLAGRSMGQVNETAYNFYQTIIYELMSEINSVPLYFEYYAWNIGRKEN